MAMRDRIRAVICILSFLCLPSSFRFGGAAAASVPWWKPAAPIAGSRYAFRTLSGLIPNLYGAAKNNSKTILDTLMEATPGTTVRVPPGLYYIMGGIYVSGLKNVTFQIDGELRAPEACFDGCWPKEQEDNAVVQKSNVNVGVGIADFLHVLHFYDCQHLTVTGNGTIDGSGKGWWTRYTIGAHSSSKRPKLMVFEKVTDMLVENLTFLNSPSFNVLMKAVMRAEVRNVIVNTDRNIVQQLKNDKRRRRLRVAGGARDSSHSTTVKQTHASNVGRGLYSPLQPEDLNTDGIDPNGKDIWIHDSYVVNDDDSIAVKPMSASGGEGLALNCTENVLIENMHLTGFGASIGSVSPHKDHNCVRNVTFRNISMPGTGKGVYIKSNPTCDGVSTAEITNILYEDIFMDKPIWWPIWIGPQQQQEPGSALGRKCALQYPISKHCPTQGCVTFTNITLRRIHINNPVLSPGVILGNFSHNRYNMRGLVFEDVVVNKPGAWPYHHNYQCKEAYGVALGSTSPIPACFKKLDRV